MKGKRERLPKKQAKKPPKNKGGRPSAWLKVGPRVEELMDLYTNGATMDQLAAHVGISPAALYKLKAQKEEFREAFRVGRLMQEDRLVGKLWELAMGKAERIITETRFIAPGEDPKALYRELHKGGLPRFLREPLTEEEEKEKEQEIQEIAAKVKEIEGAGLTPSVKTIKTIIGEYNLGAILLLLRHFHGWGDGGRPAVSINSQATVIDDSAAREAIFRRLGLPVT